MFLNALNTFHNKVHGSLHEVIHMVGVDSWGKFGPSYEVGKPAHLPQPPILSSRIEAYVFIRGDLPTNGVSLCLLQGPCVCRQSRYFIWADNPSAGKNVHPQSSVFAVSVFLHMFFQLWFRPPKSDTGQSFCNAASAWAVISGFMWLHSGAKLERSYRELSHHPHLHPHHRPMNSLVCTARQRMNESTHVGSGLWPVHTFEN